MQKNNKQIVRAIIVFIIIIVSILQLINFDSRFAMVFFFFIGIAGLFIFYLINVSQSKNN